ncbi:hypothetical protein KZ829_15900 [Actinoplanes hulinensis]|uniref:Uncharacterized protein n=1 Tax=Actinoplanes hulinensis TaxID=1144547 RepID=A0ABS7B2G2_9ACTN|nr:hypothetical protein [Actinoplanes hulinensis]MBW6435221.1 hypothetical protein [Actinoplanes hulinensis]
MPQCPRTQTRTGPDQPGGSGRRQRPHSHPARRSWRRAKPQPPQATAAGSHQRASRSQSRRTVAVAGQRGQRTRNSPANEGSHRPLSTKRLCGTG